MQPILVRQLADSSYEIIAGERRWRAAQLAGLTHVPVLVRSVPDNAALAMALIENIQRENLNPLEEAVGIQRLIDEFKMTHQVAADAVGRSRSAASNLLRLLKLPQAVQSHVDGKQAGYGPCARIVWRWKARSKYCCQQHSIGTAFGARSGNTGAEENSRT